LSSLALLVAHLLLAVGLLLRHIMQQALQARRILVAVDLVAAAIIQQTSMLALLVVLAATLTVLSPLLVHLIRMLSAQAGLRGLPEQVV
jgi:hypothetical protein